MVEKHYLSKEKFGALQEELTYLMRVKRAEIAKSLHAARSLGDLKENAEYHQIRELQAKTEERIFQLDQIMKGAEILRKGKTDSVVVGSTVTIKKSKGEKRTYEVVDSEETDMASGKLSLNSPLGNAMKGKKQGEEFELKTPSGKKVRDKIEKIK